MSKFRQQSSIRISPPRYTNPASGGLATGEAVILDSTPVVNTAIQLAERDRTSAQYFDYLKAEKAKQDEKDYIKFGDDLSKILKQPAVAGLNRFDTELILKKLKSARETIIKSLEGVASSNNYMLKHKSLQAAQSMMDDIQSEIVSRKNAYEQRKSEYQANGKLMSLSGQADYARRIESEPTLDDKGQYVPMNYDAKYIQGTDLNPLFKDISEKNNSSQGAGVGIVNANEAADYRKYKFNRTQAGIDLRIGLDNLLSTDKAVGVASILGDYYNAYLKRNGQKEVSKEAFVGFSGVNKENMTIILNDPKFFNEALLSQVKEKLDTSTFQPTKKDGEGDGSGQGGTYSFPVKQDVGGGKYREGTITMSNVSAVPANKNINLSVNKKLYDVKSGKYMPLQEYLSSVKWKDSNGKENTKSVKSHSIVAIREGDISVSKLKEEKTGVLDKITNVFNPKKEIQYKYSKEEHPLLDETYDKVKDKSNVQKMRKVEANIYIEYNDGSSETKSVLIDADEIQQTKKQKYFRNRGKNNQRSW